ncbi:uncharacterized protein [Nicotiana sylvestris]|uniref:Pre-rRNA-processing protein TSR2 homolog n=1 Tax=Nicotiana sylvestris TaxID=4096 RepID=A0A1U7V754_NICSY|nr:PREDICTED: pre-rRNA-processing protein TSR2 homolog [Nicotiana sylvestris]
MGNDNNAAPAQLTVEAAAQLQEGIGLVLGRWTALQMATENDWGGRNSREKSSQLNLDIFSAFTNSKEKVYMDDIEEILDEFMLSLNTEVNDGSLEEVAEKMMFMHEECLEGNFNSIKLLRETNVGRRPATYVRQDASDDDDSSDDGNENLGSNSSDMAIDYVGTQSNLGQGIVVDEPAMKQPAEVDEDGWMKVATRRNRGRRN